MRRICCLSDYSTPVQTERLRVSPPVFATPTDAWNHFVRHPDDYPLSDDDDFNAAYDRQSDVFDLIDDFINRPSSDGSPSELPQERSHAEVPTNESAEERSDEASSEEQPAV